MRKAPEHNYHPAFRVIADAALAKHNLRRASLPKCGARAKHSGEPCRQPAMENGKCRFHGGKTPRGRDYHKPVWPDPKSPDAVTKLQRKLYDLQRAEKKRAQRIAAMSDEELASYRKWHRAHKPGAPGPRELRRKEINDGKQLATALERPASAQEAQLQAQIDQLEERLRQMATGASEPASAAISIFD